MSRKSGRFEPGKLSTVRHIVLVCCDRMRVEHDVRKPEHWRCEVLSKPDSVLDLSAVEFGMDVERIYFDLVARGDGSLG